MDTKQALEAIPALPGGAEARVWARVQASRARSQRPRRTWLLVPLAAVAAVAAASLWTLRAEPPRTLALDAAGELTWSPEVGLSFDGQGTATGTGRDVEVTWSAGTLRSEVAPGTGTRLVVLTEEARVEVVGTVFTVTRDRLGTTTTVERGEVRVTCGGLASAAVVPERGPLTCAPRGAVQLLSRADALADGGAAEADVLEALDAALAACGADQEAVRGEVLVRRMELHGAAGRVDAALADADRTLSGPAPRAVDVRRYAGWLARGVGDCARAVPHLEALGADATPADRVLLAECVVESDPARARTLLDATLPALDGDWLERARGLRAALEGR